MAPTYQWTDQDGNTLSTSQTIHFWAVPEDNGEVVTCTATAGGVSLTEDLTINVNCEF